MTEEEVSMVIVDNSSEPIFDPDKLEEEIIVCDRYNEWACRRGAEKIINIYLEILGRKGRIPYLYEVYEDAYEYNSNLFAQMAALDIARDYDISTLTQEEYDELTDESQQSYEEMYSYNECTNLDYYTAIVLDKEGMSYISDSDDFVFDEINAEIMAERMSELDKDGKIIINDAQNIMFGAFLDNGFTTCCGDLVYTRQENALVVRG